MRFSKIRLSGFKSFVDPTDLIIADGLTGVVGPNGCGKSNLLEALRWVMGENRPTAMRGGGMEDVIFAGTDTRPARNVAEVSIHIDNSDRLAPVPFNGHDQLDIVRRITRDAGSTYKANGRDTRARDVQMLFADASTGAHSPALVRQGHIAELINAGARARRRVLEDAAGISGLYQRRREAELKLNGAEANLLRVDDVLEQLAAQLAALARQARQVARYREIGAELRQAEGVLLYLRWQEANTLRLNADTALQQAVRAAAAAETLARQTAATRKAVEADVPPKREEEAIASALLQRITIEHAALEDEEARTRTTIETLTARIDQLGRDIAREHSLNADAGGTIDRLTDEQSALTAQGMGHDKALREAHEAAHEAADALARREAGLAQRTEQAALLAAQYQSAQRMVDDATQAEARHSAEIETARKAAKSAEARLEELARDYTNARTAMAEATAYAAHTEKTMIDTEAARTQAQSREGEARAARTEAEGQFGTLDAEVRMLSRLLQQERGDGEHILDQIQVVPGFEATIGAALADDLKAPMANRPGASGWTALPPYPRTAPLPPGATALTAHAHAPAALMRRLAQVGVVDAADGARLQASLLPGQCLVTREGDLWRWDGFAQPASEGSSTTARRLSQANRLQNLSAELKRATTAVDLARAAHETAARHLAEMTDADKVARAARRDADAQVAKTSRAFSRAEADRNILAGRFETLCQTAEHHEAEAATARRALGEARATLASLDNLEEARNSTAQAHKAVEVARSAMLSKRTAHDALKREGEAREHRLAQIGDEIATWTRRLSNAETRMAELTHRKAASEAELVQAQAVPGQIATRRARLSAAIDTAKMRRAGASDALADAENKLREAVAAERDAERAASIAREARASAEARRDAATEVADRAVEQIDEAMCCTPEALLDRLDADPASLPGAERVETDVVRLRRQRDALGAVNLRAEEDARAVTEERDTLHAEKEDLEGAIKTLRTGIAALNRKGRAQILAAFKDVNRNFSMLFAHLFGGGEAKLVLVESDDPLEAGLDILCQPPGKKLSTLSLLSGGEQTLTALALIFAVFLANPAPICVLDEVDAPLDDANVVRFCDLLDEMCRRTDTRFLIITHHAVTMARMDRLFGVTMAEQGVSQLVSVDLKKAEQMVAQG